VVLAHASHGHLLPGGDFLIENAIGDRAVFSGLVRVEPLAAAIDAMLQDAASYASWKAHFGDPPPA
jgi:hypothetical protein